MKICVFGDSVTFGGYIKNNWTNLLRWHLEIMNIENVEFYNLGINGNTSQDILDRFEIEAAAREPDKIVFAFGVNGSAYIFHTKKPLVDEPDFKNNLLSLIKMAKKFTDDITFIGLVLGDDSILKPYPESTKGKSYTHVRTKIYDAILRNTASENVCKYVYLYESLDFKDFSDGLHPNKMGHKKLFDVIKKNIK